MTVTGQGRGSLTEIHGWVLNGPEKPLKLHVKTLVSRKEGHTTASVFLCGERP